MGKFKSLRICMVASVNVIDPFDDNMAGLETSVCNTAKCLAANGHDVAIVGKLKSSSIVHKEVRYISFEDWKNGKYPKYLKSIDVLAFASGPDLKSYDFVSNSTKKILLFHHQNLKFMLNANPIILLNSKVDATICVSNAVRNHLIINHINPDKLTVVPNGIDHNIFYPRNVKREPQRIMYSGALVPSKNPHLLIKAFNKISYKFLNAELHIFGDASLWGAQEYIDWKDVALKNPKIIFHGKINKEELASEYSRASICVIPSKYESFSLVSLESQACGCVPVISDVGGMPETIISNKSGFIIKPNDVNAIAKKLDFLLSNPEIVIQSSKHAIEHISKKYSWEKTAKSYEEIFYSNNYNNDQKFLKKLLKQKNISKKTRLETYMALGIYKKAYNIISKLKKINLHYKYSIASFFKKNKQYDLSEKIFKTLINSRQKDIKNGALFHVNEIILLKNTH